MNVRAVEFLEALSNEAVNVLEAPPDGSSETALLQIIQRHLNNSKSNKTY